MVSRRLAVILLISSLTTKAYCSDLQPYELAAEVLALAGGRGCDSLAIVTDHEDQFHAWDFDLENGRRYARPFFIALSWRSRKIVPPAATGSGCLLTLISASNATEVTEYLKEAWSLKRFGSAFIYVVFESGKHDVPAVLTTELLQFHRLFYVQQLEKNFAEVLAPFMFDSNKEANATRTGHLVKVARWTPGEGFRPKSFLATSVYDNFGGSTMRVVLPTITIIFAIKYHYPDGRLVWAGADYQALQYLQQVLNFRAEVVHSPDRQWGGLVDKKTNRFNGMIGMVQRGEADLAMGAITRNGIRDTVVDFTYPYFVSNHGITSRKPSPLPKYLAILWPFENEVWMGLVLVIVFSGPVYWFFSIASRRGFGIRLTIYDAVIQCGQVLLNQTLSRWPVRWYGRALMTGWVMFCLVVGFAYCGNLMASLTIPQLSPAINSIADLMRHPEITINFYHSSSFSNVLSTSTDPAIRALSERVAAQGWNRTHTYKPFYTFPHKVMAEEGSAYIGEMDHSRMVDDFSFYPARLNNLHYSREGFLPAWYAYAVGTGSPIVENINKGTSRILEFGLQQKWILDAKYAFLAVERAKKAAGKRTYRVDLRKTFGDHSNEVVAALTLNNLQGPLYLYAISVGVVVLVFLFELALAKFKYRPSTQ